MTEIKICGLTDADSVRAVNRFRPEYAGFVFAKSRRRVTVEAARALIRLLDPVVVPVGVFVNEEAAAVASIAAACGLRAVQLHGNEDGGYVRALKRLLPGTLVIKAVRVRDQASLKAADTHGCDLFLLDAWRPGGGGGTGETFDWELARGFEAPFLLAGGLDAKNVSEAVGRCAPLGVDVSSGVETDGRKDAAKIAEFIEIVRGKRG